MEPKPSPPDRRFNPSLIIGVLFLFMMALAWSLDTSLRYIFFGAAAFCLINGFIKWGSGSFSFPVFNAFRDDVRTIFSKPDFRKPQPQAQRRDVRVIIVAFVFIAFVFMTIAFSVIFISAEDDDFSDYSAAVTFESAGSYDSAALYYRRGMANEDTWYASALALGNLHYNQNNYDSAYRYYTLVLDYNPDDLDVRYNKAMASFYLKDYQRSMSDVRIILRQNPDYVNANQLAGDNYYVRDNYDSAIVWYEKAYALGLRSAFLSHVIAYIYDSRGKSQESIPYYKEALYYDSTKSDVMQRLGELLPGRDGETYRSLARKYPASQ